MCVLFILYSVRLESSTLSTECVQPCIKTTEINKSIKLINRRRQEGCKYQIKMFGTVIGAHPYQIPASQVLCYSPTGASDFGPDCQLPVLNIVYLSEGK